MPVFPGLSLGPGLNPNHQNLKVRLLSPKAEMPAFLGPNLDPGLNLDQEMKPPPSLNRPDLNPVTGEKTRQ